MPILMVENIIIGNVHISEVETKLTNTMSSKDIIKDNNHATKIDLDIMGKVILKNTLICLAPKSSAASSIVLSTSFIADFIIILA